MLGGSNIGYMSKLPEISRAMEDYLESIYRLQMQKRVVRVRDIASDIGVKAPTVSETLRLLNERGLVKHERYEDVQLSQDGSRIAQEVHNRHRIISGFLTDVLRVDPETAEKDACAIEHNLSRNTMARLITFMGYVNSDPEQRAKSIQLFEQYADHERQLTETLYRPSSAKVEGEILALSDMQPGQEGIVRRIRETGPIRRRLMEMGVIRGERVRFMREAPLGDPIEIHIRGYNLSLRKAEASAVEVLLDGEVPTS